MTRENKVGLAVCGSFVCLVGAVAALKLHEPAASAAGSPDNPPAVATAPPASAGDKTEPIRTDPPAPPAAPPTVPAPPDPTPPAPPANSPPHPQLPASPPPKGWVIPASATALPEPDAPPMLPPVQPSPPAIPPAAPPAPSGQPMDVPPPAPPPPDPPSPPGPPADLTPPSLPGPPALPDLPPVAADDPKPIVGGGWNGRKPVPGPMQNSPPGPPDPPAPLPAPPAPLPEPPSLPPAVGTPTAQPPLDPPGPRTIQLPPAPPPAAHSGHEITIPPAPPPAAPGVIAATPPTAGRTQNPPASSTPLVDSWDERAYVWKRDDTFAAVSKREFNTEDYAVALQMYNRNHPRASASLRRDGAAAEGDKIYIPPPAVLERRHADAITKSKPKPVSIGSGETGPVQAGFQSGLPPAPPPAPIH